MWETNGGCVGGLLEILVYIHNCCSPRGRDRNGVRDIRQRQGRRRGKKSPNFFCCCCGCAEAAGGQRPTRGLLLTWRVGSVGTAAQVESQSLRCKVCERRRRLSSLPVNAVRNGIPIFPTNRKNRELVGAKIYCRLSHRLTSTTMARWLFVLRAFAKGKERLESSKFTYLPFFLMSAFTVSLTSFHYEKHIISSHQISKISCCMGIHTVNFTVNLFFKFC